LEELVNVPAVSERDIRLDLISSTEWRVCDRRFAEHDHRAVLGVIARNSEGYEAVPLDNPRDTRVHVSLAAATASFWDPQFFGPTDGS
jgi:hypothetical protein